MEKRKRTRVSFSIKAEVARPSDGYRRMNLKDISLRGLYVYTKKPFNNGQTCNIRISLLKRNNQAVINLKGVVVRTDDEGMSIQFAETDADSFHHLKNIIYYNTGEPEKIDRELTDTTILNK